jgi:membrane fusion protein (multidrug efflux system)
MFVDGSQSPPLKFEQVEYQTSFEPPKTKRTTDNSRRRKRLLILLAAFVLVAGGGYGTYWWLVGRHYETTNDAYLDADSVTIAPKVSGYLVELKVEDNQRVHRGDVLARIDPRDYQTALQSAEAELQGARATAANIDAQIEEQRSAIAQAQAAVDADRASATFSEQEFNRYRDLAKTGVGTAQRLQQSQSELAQRRAALARDRAGLSAAKAHVDVLRTHRRQADAEIAGKTAALAQAKINLGQTTITAPVDGVVGDRTVRQGQLVAPGTRLMTLVPTDKVYLVANFKETQTGRMAPGQKVEIDIDSYPGQTIAGTIDSLAPGTGAQFALLPPENATGNFTKIVQRVPVKIALDPGNPLTARLRPGLSVTATVDTRSAPQPQQPAVNQAAR